ncbi:MAG: hypothetical protein Q9207_007329 [Kuettlingeria erythrocarpa]
MDAIIITIQHYASGTTREALMSWLTHLGAAAITFLLVTGSISAPAAGSSEFEPNSFVSQDDYPQKPIKSPTPNSHTVQELAASEPTWYRPHPPQATLRISQYARKIPGDPGTAGNYHIMASVINSTDQYPNGALLGSTSVPQVTFDGRVTFPITTDRDTRDVTVETTMTTWKMVDPDSADLVIIGFPARNQQLWSSESRCQIGSWEPVGSMRGMEKISALGYTKREIRCYG